MSHDQGPGISMFQGAENLSLEINGKSPEEEEDIEDDNRRKEELREMLKSAFDDLNTDDDSSVAESSHYSGVSHPHETSTACENIQPSISPCEVDYNKVIEFESRPDESHYCLNRSADSQQNSSADKSLTRSSSGAHHNDTSVSSCASSTHHHGITSPSHSPGNTGIASSSVTSPPRTSPSYSGKFSSRRFSKRMEHLAHQGFVRIPPELAAQRERQYQQNHSPGGGGLLPTAAGDGPHEPQDPSQLLKFKQLERQYEKRVREIEDLRHYIEQMDNKYDEDKVRMEKILQAELEDKEKLNLEFKCSEDEKKRVEVLEREIQELRGNVNNLVKMKENTNKELDVSRITIYDLQQKIQLLEQKKSVSKSMKSYERIIEQLKTDYEKQEKYYQSVQNKVLTEFERLKGELEKIRTEKDKMATEINRSVDFIRNKLLDDPGFDINKLKELENVEGTEDECGFSVIKTLQQFLRMKQCDILKSLKPCRNSLEGEKADPCATPQLFIEQDNAPSISGHTPDQEYRKDNLKDKPPKSSPPSSDKLSTESKASPISTTPPVPSTPNGKSPKRNNEVSASPAAGKTSAGGNKNNNLAELNSILLDRLKKRESQLKSMTVECLSMSEVHFDSMKAVMNDFVRYHFAESLRNVSKPPTDTSAETIAHMIDQERRKDDLLKEFLDNFRAFISEKKKEKLKHIQEIQADFSNLSGQGDKVEPTAQVTTCTAQEHRDTTEDDEQLLFDLKKMKDSFVNEINHVREELIKLDKENETLRNKCEDYEKRNKSVMEELATLKDQMGHQGNSEGASNNNKKKGKSKNSNNKSSSSTNQSMNEADSTKPEDIAKLEKSLDLKLMHEKNELLKALNRAHNEIKSKESLLQRMECDYYDKIVEMEQHSVDLYAEQVHKIESKQQSLMPQIESFKESLKEHVQLIKNQKAEIQELRLRDSVLTMENERLNQKLEDMKKKKKLSLDPTNQDSQHERNENQAERGDDEENNDCNVSVENIDTIEYQIKFQLEYEKLRDVCKQWSEEVRELRHRLSSSEANLEALRVKYKSIRKSALGYKRLAAEREKRLLEEKESHKQHLDDIQVKMAKTIHKREAEINAKIAEIEKCNNEKLKVIMMLQRTAENNGKAIINQLNNHTKGSKSKKCSNENVNPDAEMNVKSANVNNKPLTNGDVEEIKNNNTNNNTSKKNNNSKVNNVNSKVNNVNSKVNNVVANNNAKAPVSLKKKKTEL